MAKHPKPKPGPKLPEDEIARAVERLREIVAASQDALLTEGPVHPDHELLGLCAEALHWRRHGGATHEARMAEQHRLLDRDHRKGTLEWTEAEYNRAFGRALEVELDYDKRMRRVLFEARKLPAKTAAGIYAKALIVRSTKTGSMLLAMSLADDLIALPQLRTSLWPAPDA